MKNILTIDFDIIMAPCIDLYNNLVPFTPWDKLLKNPYIELATADLIHYQRLTNFFINDICNKIQKEKIHFIENHGLTIKYIPKDENFNIINIDHHHDLGYQKDKEKINCANWVYYIYKNPEYKMQNYIWINNENSLLPIEEYKKKIITKNINLKNFNFKLITDIDELIICLSEPWIPYNYRNLFFVWIDIFNKIYNTSFILETEDY